MNSWGLTKTQNNFSGARDLMCLTWCQATTTTSPQCAGGFSKWYVSNKFRVTSCKFKCMSRHNSKRKFGHHKQKAKAMNRKKLMLAQPQRTPPTPWTNRNSSKTRYHTWFFFTAKLQEKNTSELPILRWEKLLRELIPNAWLTLWPVRRTTSAIRTRNSRPPKMAAAIVSVPFLSTRKKLRLLHHSLEKFENLAVFGQPDTECMIDIVARSSDHIGQQNQE